MAEKKSVKIGTVLNVTNKQGKIVKTLKLGQSNPNKPEYDYTVMIKVLNAKGETVAKLTNPWVNLNTPHEKAPKNIVNELVVWTENES